MDKETPTIVVYYQCYGFQSRVSLVPGKKAYFEFLGGVGKWEPESDDGVTDPKELAEAMRVMCTTTPIQDEEGRWVYGDAPKGRGQ